MRKSFHHHPLLNFIRLASFYLGLFLSALGTVIFLLGMLFGQELGAYLSAFLGLYILGFGFPLIIWAEVLGLLMSMHAELVQLNLSNHPESVPVETTEEEVAEQSTQITKGRAKTRKLRCPMCNFQFYGKAAIGAQVRCKRCKEIFTVEYHK